MKKRSSNIVVRSLFLIQTRLFHFNQRELSNVQAAIPSSTSSRLSVTDLLPKSEGNETQDEFFQSSSNVNVLFMIPMMKVNLR